MGRPLLDNERVTAQIVSNWFASKRKDLRKGVKGGNLSTLIFCTRHLYINVYFKMVTVSLCKDWLAVLLVYRLISMVRVQQIRFLKLN